MSLLTLKSTDNTYTYPALAVTGGISLAGIPVRKATAISRLTGLVGDFSQTEMLTREGITVAMSYEDTSSLINERMLLLLQCFVAITSSLNNQFVQYYSFVNDSRNRNIHVDFLLNV